jgi:alpha-ketoglutaric semialdehyde dehydrogenase
MITGKNYIGNQLVGGGSKTIKSFNPQLNMENPWDFIEATPEEMEHAVALADQAFSTYKHLSGKEKAVFLQAITYEILALGNELLDVYSLESGLPKGRAEGERDRMIGQLNSFVAMLIEGSWVKATIDTAMPDRLPVPKEDLRKMMIPIGPIVVFGPSNFPFAFSTAGGDTASALAAGCPVIVKSHSMHLATGEMVASAIIKAAKKTNMPEGVFSNLIGGIPLGASLVKHPLVKGVGFTGSIKGGRALFDLAAQRPEPIPVFAEMGSINPVVFLPEALKKNSSKWAAAYARSITQGTGQFCTNPGLMLAIKGESLNQFTSQLSQEMEKIAPSCMLHPSVKNDFTNSKNKIQSQSGVSTAIEYKESIAANYAPQTILTVNGDTFLKNETLHQEVFGPFSIIVQCDDMEQLLDILNKLDGQLTGTIIAEATEIQAHSAVIEALQNKVGRIIFNGVPTGVEVCPAMIHGGPYPASTDSRFTAVGIHAVDRWVRPFSYQNWPDQLLPEALQNANPLGIRRTINNLQTQSDI